MLIYLRGQVCRKRNETKENHHSFIMQDGGDEKVYLVNRSMFHLASRRRQLIASAKLDEKALKAYHDAKKENPSETFFLSTQHKEDIDATMLSDGSFEAVITTKAGYFFPNSLFPPSPKDSSIPFSYPLFP